MNAVVASSRDHLARMTPAERDSLTAQLLGALVLLYESLEAKEQEYREMAAILSLGVDLLHEETGGMTKDDIRSLIEQLVTDRDAYIRDPVKRHGVYASGQALFGVGAVEERSGAGQGA